MYTQITFFTVDQKQKKSDNTLSNIGYKIKIKTREIGMRIPPKKPVVTTIIGSSIHRYRIPLLITSWCKRLILSYLYNRKTVALTNCRCDNTECILLARVNDSTKES